MRGGLTYIETINIQHLQYSSSHLSATHHQTSYSVSADYRPNQTQYIDPVIGCQLPEGRVPRQGQISVRAQAVFIFIFIFVRHPAAGARSHISPPGHPPPVLVTRPRTAGPDRSMGSVVWDAAENNAGALSIIIFVGIGLDPCFIFGLFHNADACSQ